MAAAAAMLQAGAAQAVEVRAFTVAPPLGAGDPVQKGRLSRTGQQSDWSAAKRYPGLVNKTAPYRYRTVEVAFEANALQDVFYEITVDDPAAAVFASAYGRRYDPAAPRLGYLGDAGDSGEYFGVNARFFDVVVPRGGMLTLLFNATEAPAAAFGYQVSAFSDTMYGEDFALPGVPETPSWLLLLAGFGAAGLRLRRRGRCAA